MTASARREVPAATATGTLVMERPGAPLHPPSGIWRTGERRDDPALVNGPAFGIVGDAIAEITEDALAQRRSAVRFRRTSIALGLAFAVAVGLAASLAVELSARPALLASAARARPARDAFGGAHRLEIYDGAEVKVLAGPAPVTKPERPRARRGRAPAAEVDLSGRDLLGEGLGR
jgi:hypothetical protein